MSEKNPHVEAVNHGASVLTLRDVTFGYEPDAAVVHGISGEIRPGRVCGVIGPNAAGKSTLMKLMLGQLEPWEGEVRLSGRRTVEMPPRERARHLSYVPQRGGVSFAFTAGEVVAMGRYAAGADASAVARAVEACELGPLVERTFSALSAGQQQRVLVARAMAQAWSANGYAGRAMLLDEPGSNMDLRHSHALMQRLKRLASQGLAVVIVLHDLNLASHYCDDVWLLDQGRLVAAGGWADVLRTEVLEPVYDVPLRAMVPDATGRPVFLATPSDTLSER